MAIDYSMFAIKKNPPPALVRAGKRKTVESQDKTENAKAKRRAKGQCEVRIVAVGTTGRKAVTVRCERPDRETHHLLGGIGRRNKGNSILADYKIRVCQECHKLITGNILKTTTAKHDAATVKYWMAK